MDVEQYESAVADPLALESLELVKKINNKQRNDLMTLCQQVTIALNCCSIKLDNPGDICDHSHSAVHAQVSYISRLQCARYLSPHLFASASFVFSSLDPLTCQFIPGLADATDLSVTVTTIDRLGMDIRVSTEKGERTDEYRVGFLVQVLTMEDAKSEIVKIFQEAWEKEQGEYWEDMGPPIVKTQADILERK